MNEFCIIFLLFVSLISGLFAQVPLILEPTRPVNIWDPFRQSTTTRSSSLHRTEVLVRLAVGDLIGRKVILPNLPWTPTQNTLGQIHQDWTRFEPNPVVPNNNVTVVTFLGVPYAEPPVSQRRFKPPQLLTVLPGDGPFLAFNHPPTCAQDVENRPTLFVNDPYPFQVSEDCLYLNIFTPGITEDAYSYPVVVFFHGGNFQTGSSNEWPGYVLASSGLVVVTVNYRLGAFGFMSLGDQTSGNYGLLDQRAALQFVQDHIGSFGGNPKAVTIAGHDAGAVSVGLHMLSPYSKNLFRAGAAMSGAEISYHSTIGKPALAFNNTVKLGRYLGCTQLVAEQIWDCILTRSTNDIIQAVETIPIEYNRYLFLPTIDGKIIPGNPLTLLSLVPSGGANYPSPVPYLTGINRDDGAEVILEDRLLGEFNDFLLVDHNYLKSYVLEYAFRRNYTTNREALAEAIIDRYTYWPDPSDEEAVRQEFVHFATDAYYVAPVSLSADLHSAAGSRVYMYVNNYQMGRGSDNRFLPSWMSVCHDCDLYLLFGFPFMPSNLLPQQLQGVNWTTTDRNASLVFITAFQQFAKFMNPNLPSDSSWLAFEPRRHWYMNFNYTPFSDITIPGELQRDYRWEFVGFWNVYIPSLVQYMTTTFSPFEAKVRRALVAYQISIGVVVCVLMVVIVLMCLFAYLLFERNPKRLAKEMDRKMLIRNADGYRSKDFSQETNV